LELSEIIYIFAKVNKGGSSVMVAPCLNLDKRVVRIHKLALQGNTQQLLNYLW